MKQENQMKAVPKHKDTLNFNLTGENMIAFDEDMECYYQECHGCENKRHAIYSSKELVEALVKQIYIEGAFRVEDFEQIVDDLCHCLNVKILYAPIQIEQKKKENKRIKLEKCA